MIKKKNKKDVSKYQGIIPAFYACYDKNGDISAKGVEALTNYYLEKGVKGVYVGGSSGECIYQSVEERKLVLETIMKTAGDKLTVIAHVGCNSTRDSIELAKHAESLGVDAIASIPPIYFHLPDYAIADYWNDMSKAAPKTDFVIYNIPQLAGVGLSMPLLNTMLKNKNVIGVKNSSMPVQDIQMFKDAGTQNGRPFVVFNGPDEQLVSGLAMGADGGIGGTYGAMPELYMKIFDLVKAGDIVTARQIQNDCDRIIYALCSCKGNMYHVIKEVLKKREGLDLGAVRKPLYSLEKSDAAQVKVCVKMIDEAYKKWVK